MEQLTLTHSHSLSLSLPLSFMSDSQSRPMAEESKAPISPLPVQPPLVSGAASTEVFLLGTDRFRIRQMVPQDEETVTAMERRCPQGNDLQFVTEYHSGYSSRSSMYEASETLVIERLGDSTSSSSSSSAAGTTTTTTTTTVTAGIISRSWYTMRSLDDDSALPPIRCMYLFALRVAPEFRGHGLAPNLLMHLSMTTRSSDPDPEFRSQVLVGPTLARIVGVATVLADNGPVLRAFQKLRANPTLSSYLVPSPVVRNLKLLSWPLLLRRTRNQVIPVKRLLPSDGEFPAFVSRLDKHFEKHAFVPQGGFQSFLRKSQAARLGSYLAESKNSSASVCVWTSEDFYRWKLVGAGLTVRIVSALTSILPWVGNSLVWEAIFDTCFCSHPHQSVLMDRTSSRRLWLKFITTCSPPARTSFPFQLRRKALFKGRFLSFPQCLRLFLL